MAATLTNQAKHTATVVEVSKHSVTVMNATKSGNNLTWNQATFTWDGSKPDTWDTQGPTVINQTKS